MVASPVAVALSGANQWPMELPLQYKVKRPGKHSRKQLHLWNQVPNIMAELLPGIQPALAYGADVMFRTYPAPSRGYSLSRSEL